MSGKYALIIANTEYQDSGLAQLTTPGRDAEEFARVLLDKNICAFDNVQVTLNQPEYVVREAIDDFFNNKKPDDLLVLYFSGHGVRDEFGSLYLAVKNTVRAKLRATGIKSDYIREVMDQSRSKRQVLILDCCNSGAFTQGTKAATGVSIGTASAFETGYGRIILTASDSTQYAWEGDKVIGETDSSLFTHYLVAGLEGEADIDGDGRITVDELYDYAYEKVILATPKQTPSKFTSRQQGEIILRESTRIEDVKPAPLPPPLIQSIENPFADIRLGAVRQLAKLMHGKNLGLARSAREALEKIAREDDSLSVSQAAQQALEPAQEESGKAEGGLAGLLTKTGQWRRRQVQQAASLAVGQVKPAEGKIENAGEAPRGIAERIKKAAALPERKSIVRWAVMGTIGAAALTFILWGLNNAVSRQPAVTATSPAASLEAVAPAETADSPTPEASAPEMIPEQIELPILEGFTVPFGSEKIALENADEIIQLARWGKGTVNQVVYSKDGEKIAAATSYGVYIFDADTLAQVLQIGTNNWIYSVAFSPDGEMLASSSWDNTIRLWRASDGSLLRTLEGHTGDVYSLDFSPDGRTLASGSFDNTIRLWRPSDGTLLQTLSGHTSYVKSVAFSPDGTVLASGSDDRSIRLWRVDNGSLLQALGGHTGSVLSVAFSPDGTILASGSVDNTVRQWRVSDGSLIETFQYHNDDVNSVAFSPNGENLASGSDDGSIVLHHIEGMTRQIDAHTEPVLSVAISPDGQTLVSGSLDNTIRIGEISGFGSQTLGGSAGKGYTLAFSPDGQMLASGSWGNTIRVWRVSDGTLLQTLAGHSAEVRSVAFSPDGQILASGSNDNTIRLWRVSSGSTILTLGGHQDDVASVAFSPDGQILASGSNDNTIRLWRVSDGSLLQTLQDIEDNVLSVAFSPDGKTLAAASSNSTVALWRVIDGSLLMTFLGHSDSVLSVAFSPDGKTLASGSLDNRVILWNVNDGSPLRILEHAYDVFGVAFSPDGQTLAVASSGVWDHGVVLWNVGDGAQIKMLRGHTDRIFTVVFSPDGRILASGSFDGTIRLWGVMP
ncbi:MAG: hypothetical protein HND47_10300 [Chloroflexi bacterium]|nr:hypothetical protein [Chloroflexota bacterium]